jgi:hypothetical protein
MFNLRKCRVGPCVPDQDQLSGFFTLQGQKVYQPTDKKNRRMRNYQFRAPLLNAQALHRILSRYCNGGGVEVNIEDDASTTSMASMASMASSTSSGTTVCGDA